MAIIQVGEKWEHRTVSETASDGFTATRVFQAMSDIPDESESVVLADNRIPQLGSLFPGSTGVFLTERTPARTAGSREEFMVTCNYKSILTQDERDRAQHKNPLDRKATVEIVSRKVMRVHRRLIRSNFFNTTQPTDADFKERSASNSASDPWEPLYELQEQEYMAVVKKNVDSIPDWFWSYGNSVNNAAFDFKAYGKTHTVPKGCARLGEIAAPKAKQENGIEYVQLAFQIEFRVPYKIHSGLNWEIEPFDEPFLDAGMRTYELANDGTTARAWRNVTDIDDNSVALPVPFDGSGQPIGTPGDGRIEEADMWWTLGRPCVRRDFGPIAAYLLT